MRHVSITHRLILTVLLLELLSAAALVSAMIVHERHVQLSAFDADLRGSAQSLMGAVQDTDDANDSVMLDFGGIHLDRRAIYLIKDEPDTILGSNGEVPTFKHSTTSPDIQNIRVHGRQYRFIVFEGIRVIDPGRASGGIRHNISIIYGMPVGRVWHEVFEAVRFFTIATAVLIGMTAVTMVWLIRRGLQPVYELAHEAEQLNAADWRFNAPASARQTVELQPLAMALEGALARVERSFEQQRRFTSDAAHELKTDVSIVKSSLQLLVMRKRTVDEYNQGLARSLEDFTRLESTVQKMLTLARLEQPEQLKARSSNLREVIEEAVHQSQPLAQLKNVRVKSIVPIEISIPVDRRDSLLLCSNILVNALEHSGEGSEVRITLAWSGSNAQLVVEDEGEGIREEDRPHLLEPFYRGDPSRSRKSGGTGLGLAICKAICERVNGSIEVANRAARGAIVTVMLPGTTVAIYSASVKAK